MELQFTATPAASTRITAEVTVGDREGMGRVVRMLRLEKVTVVVVPHDPDWSRQFHRVRKALQQHIGQYVLAIEHVGSTAVPRLDAKPVIDIAVAVQSVDAIDQCRQPLLAMDFIDRGDGGAQGGYLFVRESAPDVRTHHLHIVTIDDPQWTAYLSFRDLLIDDVQARIAYANLKHSLGQVFAENRSGYTRAKNDFIRQQQARTRGQAGSPEE